MNVRITIEIEVDEETFYKNELKYDILEGFPERTGYDIQYLDIEIDDE